MAFEISPELWRWEDGNGPIAPVFQAAAICLRSSGTEQMRKDGPQQSLTTNTSLSLISGYGPGFALVSSRSHFSRFSSGMPATKRHRSRALGKSRDQHCSKGKEVNSTQFRIYPTLRWLARAAACRHSFARLWIPAPSPLYPDRLCSGNVSFQGEAALSHVLIATPNPWVPKIGFKVSLWLEQWKESSNQRGARIS